MSGLTVTSAGFAAELPPAAKKTVDFRSDVYPLLAARCFRCHSGRNPKSGFRLDDRAEILGETNGTPLVKVGRSAESRMIELVAGLDDFAVMPPEGKRLTAAEIGVLRAWIDQDLKWDETLLPPVVAKTDHWAFQPITRPPVPETSPSERVLNPIDAFIAARRTEHGLAAAVPASRRVLIRRLSLDLTGLPPTPEEVERFVNDDAPNAYERLVERLLDSPTYGERWGRHWLDVARWSETEGYESNHPRAFAWRYRDWVVRAFNRDKPYDEFVRQQIAGDELTPYSDENLIATGFLSAARISSNEEDKWLQRNQVLVDVANTVGSAFLGLTMGCAQCHNHKFDAISTRDYYRLHAYFLSGQPLPVVLKPNNSDQRPSPLAEEYLHAVALKETLFQQGRERALAEAVEALPDDLRRAIQIPREQRTPEQEQLARRGSVQIQPGRGQIEKRIPQEDRKLYDELKKKIERLEAENPVPQTFAWYSPVTSPHNVRVLPQLGFYPLPYEPGELAVFEPYLMVRGDVHNIGPEITPGWPAVFETTFEFETEKASRGTRIELADWLTDPRHPLTARVWVNRIWHYHFGRGIVATPGDFGVRGEPPSHPALLDWLANELIEGGWSTKHIHRLIVLSGTYRQSSVVTDPRALEIDAENRYLWHWRPRRLEAEAIRDSMLTVTGELDRTFGGASVPLDEADESHRRSLYLYQKRGLPPEMQKLFDGPSEASESCSRRQTSTSPLQPLYLLNNEFSQQRARGLAARIRDKARDDRRRQIELAFVYALNRQPDDGDIRTAEKFFDAFQPPDGDAPPGSPALLEFCLAVLNLNEFVYLE